MPETSPEAEDVAIGAEHFGPSMDLGLLSADDSWEPCQVEPILTLGKGRAARAMLVRATDAEGNERLCVEKIFAPGLLTRLIYRCVFQSRSLTRPRRTRYWPVFIDGVPRQPWSAR
ncbi:MAG: hypothetical protein CM1200mP2_16260 [Planctomycetaceae bacterium]|nr:MAG: hypothetical protein CM1200mP2_16260 [Planctomycetaceae bacterium]